MYIWLLIARRRVVVGERRQEEEVCEYVVPVVVDAGSQYGDGCVREGGMG